MAVLRDKHLAPTFIETVEPIELAPKDSPEGQSNGKKKRNSNIEAKIQLSANRLSSKNGSTKARDCYESDEKGKIELNYISQSSKENS